MCTNCILYVGKNFGACHFWFIFWVRINLPNFILFQQMSCESHIIKDSIIEAFKTTYQKNWRLCILPKEVHQKGKKGGNA